MAFDRQNTIYEEGRAAAGAFIGAWRRLQDVRDAFDAVGGLSFFTAFFAQNPAPEVSSDEFYALMISTNALDTLMASGHSANLHKARH